MNPYLFAVALSLLVYRAHRRRSLTPPAIAAAILTACVHGAHAYNLPFVLLITFYALGTAATKVKHDVKAKLTVSSTGAGGGEGARGATQVFANSAVASVLAAASAWRGAGEPGCFGGELLMVGIIVCVPPPFLARVGWGWGNRRLTRSGRNYAAVTADTLSSELGILSRGGPRLVTTLRRCPPGTNGGVSATGLLAGAAGAAAIAAVSAALLPWCDAWPLADRARFAGFVAAMGTAGSVLDSVLGAVLQASVVDARSGKIVEAPRGGKVLVRPSQTELTVASEIRSRFGRAPSTAVGAERRKERETDPAHAHDEPSRRIATGRNVLSNNGVNFAMAALTSAAAMVLAGWWWHGQPMAVVAELTGA